MPLFCVSSGTDRAKAGVTGATAQVTRRGYAGPSGCRRSPRRCGHARSRQRELDGDAVICNRKGVVGFDRLHAALARTAPQKPARTLLPKPLGAPAITGRRRLRERDAELYEARGPADLGRLAPFRDSRRYRNCKAGSTGSLACRMFLHVLTAHVFA